MPEGVRAFGVWLKCKECDRDFKFDGLRVRKKERERDAKR
jgi:hypothetical protein